MSTSEEAKEIIRRWNEEGWSGGKYDLAYEIISPNMQVHGAGGQAVGMGPDGLIDLIKTWRTAFPDGRMEIDDLIVEGDTVAIRNTWYGTQSEEFYGIPPSGKSVAVTSVGIDRVQGGLVTEGWGELDMVGMMQADGRAAHRRPRRGRGRRRLDLGADRVEPTARTRLAGREPRDPARASSRRSASADAEAAGELVDAGAFVDHSPGWGTRELRVGARRRSATLRAAMPDLALRGRPRNMVCEGNQVAGALGRPRHAHRRAAVRRGAVGQGDRLDAQRLRPASAAARSSSGGRPPTCSRSSSRPACCRRMGG